MLTYRTEWVIKLDKMEEAQEFLVAWIKREKARATVKAAVNRIYIPDLSPNLLVYEESWETVADRDAMWEELNQRPETAANFARWDELVERQLGTERWIVTEIR